MRAIVIDHSTDGPAADAIRIAQDFPDPTPPGPGEALIRTLAVSLNHLDLWVVRGVPGLKLTYPRTSGSDACGVVEAVGPGVDPAWVGLRVMLNAAVDRARPPSPRDGPTASLAPEYTLIGEHSNGAMGERFVAPVANLQPAPDDADDNTAAAFGLTFLTAYSMLVTKGGITAGQSVLITGIGGGVALAALAIARHLGCPACVTSRHSWKLIKAAELGAAECVIDTGQDWSKQVRAWAGARNGVDFAIDSSGKATHMKCIKSLARGGAYLTPGCTSGPDAVTDLSRIFWNQLRIFGSTMGTPDEFAQVAALFRAGKLAPIIDRVFPFEQAPAAFARLQAGEQFGKVVINFSQPHSVA